MTLPLNKIAMKYKVASIIRLQEHLHMRKKYDFYTTIEARNAEIHF